MQFVPTYGAAFGSSFYRYQKHSHKRHSRLLVRQARRINGAMKMLFSSEMLDACDMHCATVSQKLENDVCFWLKTLENLHFSEAASSAFFWAHDKASGSKPCASNWSLRQPPRIRASQLSFSGSTLSPARGVASGSGFCWGMLVAEPLNVLCRNCWLFSAHGELAHQYGTVSKRTLWNCPVSGTRRASVLFRYSLV